MAGEFANFRSDWRHFLVNCGTIADRFLAYTYMYAEITFLRYLRHFLSDFENNGTVEIKRIFLRRIGHRKQIFGSKHFWGLVVPHWGSVIRGGRLPQDAHLRHLR